MSYIFLICYIKWLADKAIDNSVSFSDNYQRKDQDFWMDSDHNNNNNNNNNNLVNVCL